MICVRACACVREIRTDQHTLVDDAPIVDALIFDVFRDV